MLKRFLSIFLFCSLISLRANAHDPLLDLPAPTSEAEAWNIITQSIANISKLLETNQLKEITPQVANCSPSLRLLQADAKKQGDKALYDQLESLYYSGDAIITATLEKESPAEKARAAFAKHQAALKPVMAHYKPETLNAQVYVCPMHPLERSLDPNAPCPKCAMKLIRRRIPASTTYEKPGEPSMKLTATPDHPLKPGQSTTVTIALTKNNGTPVTRADLLTMHTQKIHLLIVDASLSDYHHEHPKPGEKPGQYIFTFTPTMPGPYRIFADVVPEETSMQEYVIGDIPADTTPKPIENKKTTLTSEVDGFNFILKFDTPDQKLHANQTITGQLTVIAPDAQPYKQLQPVMAAFAHLVAFNEDHKTVLHIHPLGPELTSDKERGGPVLTFKLYAPKPGFYRLYAQTQIMDEPKFAPFNITIEDAVNQQLKKAAP
jgi:hypothetical protein